MRWTSLLVGIVLGVLLLGAVRFFALEPPSGVHHHANFSLFVDGERVDLSADRFMEDVASCGADPAALRPQDRVHLHNGEDQAVHVHAAGATWGHLFANLGMVLGDGFVVGPDGERWGGPSDDRRVVFVVNGFQVPSVANREIRSLDRLVISVGEAGADEVSAALFPRVPETAARFNEEADPAGCAGAHAELTPGQRLRHAFWEM